MVNKTIYLIRKFGVSKENVYFCTRIMSKETKKLLGNFAVALSYVGLLVFFTYTPLAVELISENSKFLSLYNATQSSYLSMLVNLGLLLLMEFDYVSGKRFVPRNAIIGTIVAVMMLAAVCGLAFNATTYHRQLKCIFGWEYLGMALHFCIVAYLIYVKYASLPSKMSGFVVQEDY